MKKTNRSTQRSGSTMPVGKHTMQEASRIMKKDAEMGRREMPSKTQMKKMKKACE